jgi:carbon storage regulator CsrA
MLILTRRVGEKIVINDEIVITIVEAGRDTVRIGVEAPRSVTVHRHEVWEQIANENEAARAGDTTGITGDTIPVSTSSLPTGKRPPTPE